MNDALMDFEVDTFLWEMPWSATSEKTDHTHAFEMDLARSLFHLPFIYPIT